MHTHTYMEKLECEIDELIKKESMSKSAELDYATEKELHLLFENRKHLCEYMKYKHEYNYDKHNEKISVHGRVVQGEEHKHSYFGG